MLKGITPNLFEDLLVCVRSRYLLLYVAGVGLTFVLDLIKSFRSAGRIDDAYLLTFSEKDAFHSHIGLDRHYVIVHQKAFPHSSLILVTINDVFEVGLGVS